MKLSHRIIFSIGLLLTLLATGTIGYMEIEHWDPLNALYMSIITLTTVGFTEVAPLSRAGKLFTIAYIVLGIGSAGFAITTLFTYLFEGPVMNTFKERRMNLLKKRLQNHHIVCGYGPIGREITQEFSRAQLYHVLIDKNVHQDSIKDPEYTVPVSGDPQDEDILREAKIDVAQSLIAVLDDDAANLFLVMTARQLNPSLKIIAEARSEGAIKKLKRAGADVVITPYQIVGRRIVESILKPTLTHFLDIVSKKQELSF
ncbi:TrkA family potassium uptake protein [Gracilinema caldarium]|uniref:potassium channel family protein n=1 Tax=Gracilinema caldarium TaxID=215591 RepID=UPI0026F24C34|nr:potassium channel family protein [Gracilinema caldarium]